MNKFVVCRSDAKMENGHLRDSSSGSISVEGIDFALLESDKTIRDIRHSNDEYYSRMIATENDLDRIYLTHGMENTNICTYPSGRPPLVPIDFDRIDNNKKERKKKKRSEENRRNEDGMNGDSGENFSWLSRTLCGGVAVPTDLTFDTTDQIPSQNNEASFPDHADECYSIDKGRGLFQDSSMEGEGDALSTDESLGGMDDIDDTDSFKNTEGISRHQCNNSASDETETQTKETPNEEQSPTPIAMEVNLEMFRSLDDFFRHNSVLCNTLENWYDDIEQKSAIVHPIPNYAANVHSPRNSSGNPAVRKKKIQHLCRNMAPFEIDQTELNQGVINMKKYSPVGRERIRFSFSNSGSAYPSRKAELKKERTKAPRVGECSPIITRGCGDFSDMQGMGILSTEEEEELCSGDENNDYCYDSDPTDLLSSVKNSQKRRRSKSRRRFRRSSIMNIYDVDEVTCLEKVNEHMNAKRLLVWHREATEDSTDPPIAVHAWIEHGSQLDSALIQPKFCWRKNYGKETHTNSILKLSSRYHAIDLLDISKIVPAEYYVARDQYPFVKRSCSFVIEAFEQEVVFEARDEIERDDVVEGLKLLVARLGSKIIMGDGRVLDEFFSPLGASVPGKVPLFFSD